MFAGGVVVVPVTTMDSLVMLDADTGVIVRVQALNSPPAGARRCGPQPGLHGSGHDGEQPAAQRHRAIGGIWGFQIGP